MNSVINKPFPIKGTFVRTFLLAALAAGAAAFSMSGTASALGVNYCQQSVSPGLFCGGTELQIVHQNLAHYTASGATVNVCQVISSPNEQLWYSASCGNNHADSGYTNWGQGKVFIKNNSGNTRTLWGHMEWSGWAR